MLVKFIVELILWPFPFKQEQHAINRAQPVCSEGTVLTSAHARMVQCVILKMVRAPVNQDGTGSGASCHVSMACMDRTVRCHAGATWHSPRVIALLANALAPGPVGLDRLVTRHVHKM